MHILVTADTLGGVWTYARELVKGITLRGINVTLVSFGGIPTPQQTQWMDGLPGLDYRPTAFKLEWMQDSESDLVDSSEYLKKVIAETSPDLLHFNQFYYGALECDVPRVVVAHSDVVSWWVAVHGCEPPDSPWMRCYRKVVTSGVKGATAIVAPSQWMLDQISQYYIQPKCSTVVYNGRTAALFTPSYAKENMVITVGRQWDRGKNAALLLQREMPVPVHIVGSDQHPESLAHAFSASRSNKVNFVAQQSEGQLSRLLARAAIYAATSCYEPFGLAPLEAALSRCAIVASDIPVFRELWDGAAMFFPGNDSASLYEAVELLVKNRALRLQYGNLALERAQQRFNAGRMVENYLALYNSLARVSAVMA